MTLFGKGRKPKPNRNKRNLVCLCGRRHTVYRGRYVRCACGRKHKF